MEEKLIYTCALSSLFEFRPALARAIMDEFTNLKDFFSLPIAQLETFLKGNEHYLQQLKSGDLLKKAESDVHWYLSKGVEIITIDNPQYPKLLAEVGDAPIVLYYKGNAKLFSKYSLSFVGTRLASSYGRQMCIKLLEDLCNMGYRPQIISGLAFGIDAQAHKAALDLGLETIAVLPCGIDTIYPSLHRNLAKSIIAQGAVITEQQKGAAPLRLNFIRRNRIIAAMTKALIIVESRVKGGAMLTVEYANNYSRDVLAVPGRITDINSFGCNYLISKNVAHICNNAQKIIDVLGWDRDVSIANISSEVSMQTNLFSFDHKEKEKILLAINYKSPVNIDYICNVCDIGFEQVSGILLELELEGRIKTCACDGFIRIKNNY